MSVVKRIRELFTGYYESDPVRLMGAEDAAEWIAEHPICCDCGEGIDPRVHTYGITSSSEGWTRQYHSPCPPD